MSNFKERIEKSLKETYYFLSSKIFLTNFLKANGLILGLLILVFQGLKCYTRHGEEVTVPDFRGQTLAQVKQQLKRKHLRVRIIDSTYNGKSEPLEIMDQNPLPTKQTGLKVKRNRTIYITVNATTPPQASLPAIWDKDFNFAIKILENAGFKGIEKQRRPDKAVNTILEVHYKGKKLNRKSDIQLPKGSVIELVVADGGGSLVTIPNVLCKPLSEAIFTIENSGLSLGAIIQDGIIIDSLSSYVWQQIPTYDPEELIRTGSQIDLRIQRNLPVDCSVDTDLIPDEEETEQEEEEDLGEEEEDEFGG